MELGADAAELNRRICRSSRCSEPSRKSGNGLGQQTSAPLSMYLARSAGMQLAEQMITGAMHPAPRRREVVALPESCPGLTDVELACAPPPRGRTLCSTEWKVGELVP